ncbi:DUF423 domain-containing protein [Rhodopirellula bahusiensis]|uniref:DUF423 domain-containing protein n=1 Tax=Rhodopirellula bahusiensis TaxID=2014065 RepID=A0A2G1WAN2_9BACT|nr:DUF423 domain-containing protein [Rhodopirellula bahusiensis]PHQ36102.1 hypothetical protein CEE69_07655 [Rhodopirellula bahusiensis]
MTSAKPYEATSPSEQVTTLTETESQSGRTGMIVAGLAGASAVGIGAFGAHGLPGFLEQSGLDPDTIARRVEQFETGARYHLAHAIVLLALAIAPLRWSGWLRAIRALMVAGLVFFSGSLYLLVLTNTPVMGAITPIGGVCWIVGWLMFVGCRDSSTSR